MIFLVSFVDAYSRYVVHLSTRYLIRGTGRAFDRG